MAIYNEILSPRYSRFIQKLFSMKGSSPVKALAGELQTVFNIFGGVENRALEEWSRFGAVGDAGPTAANQSGVRFRNPAGSNVVAVLEKLTIAAAANDRLLVQQGQPAAGVQVVDLATIVPVQGNRFDPRGLQAPTLVESQQATAAAIPAMPAQFTFWGELMLANTPYDVIWFENQEISIFPGEAIQVVAVTVNERLLTSAVWRERLLEEAERPR